MKKEGFLSRNKGDSKKKRGPTSLKGRGKKGG